MFLLGKQNVPFPIWNWSQKYTAHNKITRITDYLNKKDGVNILGVSKVINVQVQVRHYHQPDQKYGGHDGHGGSWCRQRQEVDEEVPGVPGPDAVVHPHTVMVKAVHTPVTHTCTDTGGSRWDKGTMHTHWRSYKRQSDLGEWQAAAVIQLLGLQCPIQHPLAQPQVGTEN